MMVIDARFLKSLIAQELLTLSDSRVVDHIRGLLIEPYVLQRRWDYGTPDQEYPCWMVLNDPKASHCEIGYCEFGFGPKSPWGLLSSGDEPEDIHMGMDSGWFRNFLDAFFESTACCALPIWKVFLEGADKRRAPITDEASWESTWDRVAGLRSSDPNRRYHVSHSVQYGNETEDR